MISVSQWLSINLPVLMQNLEEHNLIVIKNAVLIEEVRNHNLKIEVPKRDDESDNVSVKLAVDNYGAFSISNSNGSAQKPQKQVDESSKRITLGDLVSNEIKAREMLRSLTPQKKACPKINIMDSPVYERFETNNYTIQEPRSDNKSRNLDHEANVISKRGIKNYVDSLKLLSPPVAKRLKISSSDEKENIKARVNYECHHISKPKPSKKADEFSLLFTEEGKLGEGAFSVVKKIKRKKDSKRFALKTYKNNVKWPTAKGEAQILEALTHPQIIKYYGYYKRKDEVY